MFFYIVLTPISPLPVYEVPAIRVNTTKSTYTFTSVCALYKTTKHKIDLYNSLTYLKDGCPKGIVVCLFV